MSADCAASFAFGLHFGRFCARPTCAVHFAVAGRIVPFHRELHGRPIDRSLRDVLDSASLLRTGNRSAKSFQAGLSREKHPPAFAKKRGVYGTGCGTYCCPWDTFSSSASLVAPTSLPCLFQTS